MFERRRLRTARDGGWNVREQDLLRAPAPVQHGQGVRVARQGIRGRPLCGGQVPAQSKWRCEPLPMWPSATKSVELIVPIIDALSRNGLKDVKVVACNKLDL